MEPYLIDLRQMICKIEDVLRTLRMTTPQSIPLYEEIAEGSPGKLRSPASSGQFHDRVAHFSSPTRSLFLTVLVYASFFDGAKYVQRSPQHQLPPKLAKCPASAGRILLPRSSTDYSAVVFYSHGRRGTPERVLRDMIHDKLVGRTKRKITYDELRSGLSCLLPYAKGRGGHSGRCYAQR